jgi:hypothetical protein
VNRHRDAQKYRLQLIDALPPMLQRDVLEEILGIPEV